LAQGQGLASKTFWDVKEDAPKPGLSFLGMYTSVGETVLGQYQVLEQIGHGGMGQVYKARDLRLARTVALKFLPPWKRGDSKDRDRLTLEAKYASALNHPNIVTVHDIAEYEGVSFIVMEHVSGETLDRRIAPEGMPVAQALEYATQIADALTAAHGNGILHGDLKPRNIMITDSRRIKLLDFGLAKELATGGTKAPSSKDADLFGTAIWSAPEQLSASALAADARSEVFSFGLILHQILSGSHPFGPGGREDITTAIRLQTPRPLAPEVPLNLAMLVERCLEKAADRRFQAMEEVLAALKQCSGVNAMERVSKAPESQAQQRIRKIVGRIKYKSVARSGQALRELERILRASPDTPVRESITQALRELILTVEPDNNGAPPSVRKVRKLALAVLKMSAEGNLRRLFGEGQLETLDLYAMDFSEAQASGVSFKTCFLPYANFRSANLKDCSFQGSWVRNAHFTDADLTGADLSNMDWFNAVGFSEQQLLSAMQNTVLECPRNLEEMLRFLEIRYRFPFESWGVSVQRELRRTWNEYLRPAGLRDLVASWRADAPE
jgi:serine/threonine protein kinase